MSAKEAHTAYCREWRRRNPDKVAASKRKYQEAHPDKVAAYRRAYHVAHREENEARRAARENGRENEAESNREWAADHPLERKAHHAVDYALRIGALTRPTRCSVCRSTRKIVAHHDNYTRPLDVVWVCQICHADLHREPGAPNL